MSTSCESVSLLKQSEDADDKTMSLSDKITSDMKEAMKAKNNATLSTLRLLRSAIKNKQIDLGHELSDEEVQAVVKSQAKQLKDAIESFSAGDREDLADKARSEVKILETYLPEEMSDEELEKIVKQTIEESGATSKADMGKVMGAAMKAVKGQADGNRVKEMVMKGLSVFVLAFGVLAMFTPDAHASIPILDAVETVPYMETMVRVVRVLLLAFGIMFVNKILHGGFSYSVASSRDETHTSAMKEVMGGVYGTVAVALLFSVATIVLEII